MYEGNKGIYSQECLSTLSRISNSWFHYGYSDRWIKKAKCKFFFRNGNVYFNLRNFSTIQITENNFKIQNIKCTCSIFSELLG